MPRRKSLVQSNGQIEHLPSGDFLELGKLNVEPRQTITAANTITVSSSFIRLVHNGGGTQNVDTINGAERGDVLFIMISGGSNNVRVRKGNGNVRGGPNRLLNSNEDLLMLIKVNNSNWNEVSWQG